MADLSFDGWADKAKTPGTLTAGRAKGSRVSFAADPGKQDQLCLLTMKASRSHEGKLQGGACST